MNSGSTNPAIWPARIATTAGIIVSLVGAMVLLGWQIDSDRLKTVFPGLVTMKANTAFGVLLSAMALAFLSLGKTNSLLRWFGAGIAMVVVCLGAVTLAEYFLGWDAGIDEWLFMDPHDALDTSWPGRMAPSTAFCFVLTGSGILVGAQARVQPLGFSVISALGATLVGIGGVASLGQFSNAIFHFHLWNYFLMAIHTALSFVLLGVGLLALSKSGGGLNWVLDPTTSTGFAATALCMLFAACASWGYAIQLRDTSMWVNHTQQVLKGIENIRACLAELESNQRGYVIQGDLSLLQERDRSKGELKSNLQALRTLISDNAEQEKNLDRLAQAAAERTDFEDQVISVRREQGLLPAQQRLSQGDGTVLSQHIEETIAGMRDDEYRLLTQRQKNAESAAAAAFLLQPLCIFLSLTVLSLALFILNAGTRQRQTAEEASAQLAEIVNSSNDAIIGKDLGGVITSWNKGSEALYGYSASEMVGASGELLMVPGGHRLAMERVDRLTRGESVEHFETQRVGKGGRLVDVSVTVSPIKDKVGKIVGSSVVERDITQKREADAVIRKLNATLEQRVVERTAELASANEELEAFSYSISHDLRAPLRAVDGFAQAAIEDYGGQLPADGQRQLRIIRESAQRMGVLIDDLLAFSRLSRAPLVKQEIDTARQVASIVENLKGEENGRSIDVRLVALPVCLGAPALLEQVWFNLLANAFKYTRQRKDAVIEVGCRRENNKNVFFVQDNGVGFDMKYANKLFGVFQRLHRADEFEGTGVGLAIVQRILHRHGEKIWVEAAPNKGATFYFTLQEGPNHE